jgi:hypothetical protein
MPLVNSRSQGLLVRLIYGKRYLEVDQTANQRHQSKISKIWQYGTEIRALYTDNLDKY